jgi:hypothetical protein
VRIPSAERFPLGAALTQTVKPFQCPHCTKAFVEASNLTKHIRTHTGERMSPPPPSPHWLQPSLFPSEPPPLTACSISCLSFLYFSAVQVPSPAPTTAATNASLARTSSHDTAACTSGRRQRTRRTAGLEEEKLRDRVRRGLDRVGRGQISALL